VLSLSDHTVREHGVRNLYEPREVGAANIVHALAVITVLDALFVVLSDLRAFGDLKPLRAGFLLGLPDGRAPACWPARRPDAGEP